MTRRRLVQVGSLVLGLILATACLGTAAAGEAGKTLSIMSNGGYYLETLQKYVIQPFEKKYGVKVLVTESFSVGMLNRLRAEKQNPSVDLVSIGEIAAVAGRPEGLFDKMDAAKIPNLANVAKHLRNKDGYGVQSVVSPIVIVYNKEKVKTPPAAWADFWNPEYKGKVVIADIDNTMGPMFLVTAARMNGGNESNIDPGFQKMLQLKPNLSYIYKGEGQEVPQGVAQGDIWVSHMMLVKAQELVKGGAKVGIVIPKEGAHPLPYTLEIVKGAKNLDLANKFVDMALSPEAQLGFAKDLYVTPANLKVVLPDDLKGVLPTADRLMDLDWVAIAKNRSAWTDRWNREITR